MAEDEPIDFTRITDDGLDHLESEVQSQKKAAEQMASWPLRRTLFVGALFLIGAATSVSALKEHNWRVAVGMGLLSLALAGVITVNQRIYKDAAKFATERLEDLGHIRIARSLIKILFLESRKPKDPTLN